MIKIKDTENNVEYFTKYSNGYLEQYDELFMLMYVYLHRHKSIEGYVNLTIKDFLLYYNYTPNRSKGRINDKIYEILNLMIKRGFIQYIGCYSNGGLAMLEDVDCNMMFTVQLLNYNVNWNPESHFTKILYSEVDRLRHNNVKFMGKVLKLYIHIKKPITCDVENKTGQPFSYPSENTLSRECDCGVSSIKKYIEILCNIGMLYMRNYGSYLRMLKGKEIVVNSNNVYALEEKYLDDNARESLREYLRFNYGYIDGFYPFCDNLPNDKLEKTDKNGELNVEFIDPDNDDWGEPDSMEKDYPVEEIVDMPTMSDLQYTPMNPTRIINKPVHKETIQVPKDVIIQRYADDLYRQYADGTGNKKSIFIAELSEEYPGLDDYDRYYENAKKFFENVL